MEALHPVSIMDLTIDQLETLETDPRIGKPMTEWGDAPSQAYLMAAILARGNGLEMDQVTHLTFRELRALVDFQNDGDDSQDPTPGVGDLDRVAASHALALGWTLREAKVHTLAELKAMRWAQSESERESSKRRAQRTGKTQVRRR